MTTILTAFAVGGILALVALARTYVIKRKLNK